MGIVRAETIARMRGAFREGLSASRFIAKAKTIGLSYRRSDMLADWRSVANLEEKEGLLRFVRKDRYPAEKSMATKTWAMSKEYMYKVKVKSAVAVGEPITEHFVNIMTDSPMTPAMLEVRAIEERAKEKKYEGELVFEVIPWTVVRRAAE